MLEIGRCILDTRTEGRASSIVHRVNHMTGFTLIEVIIFTVVAGVVASAIFIPFMTSLKGGMSPDYVITASYLAQAKIEELTKYEYSNS